jgi:hypothetical protein
LTREPLAVAKAETRKSARPSYPIAGLARGNGLPEPRKHQRVRQTCDPQGYRRGCQDAFATRNRVTRLAVTPMQQVKGALDVPLSRWWGQNIAPQRTIGDFLNQK